MLRKDKVYEHLKNLCKCIQNSNGLKDNIGFSAEKIASDLNMVRSNVSSDLNKLYKEGCVYKVEGRPTLYIDKDWALNNDYYRGNTKNNGEKKKVKKEIKDCFTSLIGYEDSLNSQIKQAQAALLYPPYGLPTLILGDTGTGKTMFAEYMYKFSVDNNALKEKAPFVSFNCADYANNHELLMSILFGSIKGAYTGSNANKVGLVEMANGGILFLDEVHRLPPEGQEMLFTLMDKGKFRKLGDTAFKSVDVLILAATTESPESAFLKTFYRRFPIVIKMPSLKDRSVKERLMLISYFFNKEAMRIKMPIKVSNDVLIALSSYLPSANVGELKSNIELVVSRGYMDYLIEQDSIRIVLMYLSESVRNSMLYDKSLRQQISEIIGYEDKVFSGSVNLINSNEYKNNKFSNDVYFYLDRKFDEYKNINIEKEKLKDKLYKDLEDYFVTYNRGLMSKAYNESELSKFVDDKIINILKIISSEIEKKFNYYIKENTFVALAFHINSMYDRRIQSNSVEIINVKDKNPVEYDIAVYIYERLSSLIGYKIPRNEIEFISVILHTTEQEKDKLKKIPILVIAHGENVATNMVKVVTALLEVNHIVSIDMSLEDRPSDILEVAIDLCKKIDEGKGILLMVDMGSLKTFGNEITKRTGIQVITIDNLSMPALLEASHKSVLPYSNLKDVALSVLEINKASLINNTNEILDSKNKKKVIFTTCSTGKGTAAFLKKLILKALSVNCIKNVEIFEVNINDKREDVEKIKRLAGEKKIAAIAGSINPGISDVPFINLMEFVTGSGLKKVMSYVSTNQVINLEEIDNDRTVAYGAIGNALDENLNFLSGNKIMPYIDKYIKGLESEKAINFTNQIYTLLAIHLGYAVERLKFDVNLEISSDDISDSNLAKEIYKDFGIIFSKEEIDNLDLIINEGLKFSVS